MIAEPLVETPKLAPAVEPETSGEERLMADLRRHVSPRSYNGHAPSECLCGQLSRVLRGAPIGSVVYLSEKYGVPYAKVRRVYEMADEDRFASNLEAALDEAERILLDR